MKRARPSPARGVGLRDECFRKGWTQDRRNAAPAVVLMDGGRLYIPDSEYAEFLAAYARSVDAGSRLYVVERPSEVMRFFVDLDVQLPTDTSDADVDEYVARVCAEVARGVTAAKVCDPSASRAIVLRAALKRAAERVKVGVHVVFPSTTVDVEAAEACRDALTARLIADASLAPPLNGWDEAVDRSVYRQGGLRLVDSRKMETCACPSSGDGFSCSHARRRMDAGRPYEVWSVLDGHGQADDGWLGRLTRNSSLRARMCSIRTALCGKTSASAASRAPSRSRSRRPASGAGKAAALAEYIDGDLPAPHAQLRVLDVARRPGAVVLRLDGDGVRFCPNVQREHGSSCVYCVVDDSQKLLQLRCYCQKYGCRSFRATYALSQRGAAALGLRTAGQKFGLPYGFV